MRRITFTLSLLLISTNLLAKEKKRDLTWYQKVVPTLTSVKTLGIDDPISKEPVNCEVLQFFDKSGKSLGFARELATTTGCNDGCLPLIFTLYYDKNGVFYRLKSKPGLTKKDHEEYTPEDYINLELILIKAPKTFDRVGHPKEMVDGITRATLSVYKPIVVARSAYTTLRAHLYNQHTQAFLKKYLKKKK
jgi:hypothetical protein